MRGNSLNRWLGGAAMVAALLGLSGGGNPVAAQTATGNIRGYVTGTGGAPVPNAQVAARLLSTNQVRGTTTNTSGFYYLAGLRPGDYELTVRRIGMQPQTRAVTVRIAETSDINFSTSEVAARLAAVEVTAPAAAATTRTSEVGTNISREQINNLPNFERNVLDLAKLVPGVTLPEVNSTDKVIKAGGQPAEAVNVFVDGATYKNDILRGGVIGQDASKGNPLPQGAIDQFRILTQNYKAEYQRAGGAIIVATTRSGTNRFEADGFAYGVGKAYVAKDAIGVRENLPRPDYQRLQAGGNIGGAFVPDKLFYFGTYELNFRDEPAYVTLGGNAPTAPPALVQRFSAYTGQFVQRFREHLALGKLTWQKSDRSTVDASVSFRNDNDFRNFGGQTSYEAAENLHIATATGVVNFRHAGDKWLNEAQLNTQWFNWKPTGRNSNLIAQNYFGLMRVGGKEYEQDFKQRRISLRDDVTRSALQAGGEHVIKMGVSVDFLNYDATKYAFRNPLFNYRSDENWSRPFEVLFGAGDPRVTTNNTQFGAYVQDDWSIGRRLILNLGIRWDAETNMINNDYVTPQPLRDSLSGPLRDSLYVNQPQPNGPDVKRYVVQELGGIQNFISNGRSSRPMYLKAIQPRLGASYDLMGNGRTVLFGGGGVYFDRNYWNTLYDESFRRQWKQTHLNINTTCAPGDASCLVWDPKYYDPAQLRALPAAPQETYLVKNDLQPPRTIQFSAGIRQTVGAQLVTLSYNGIRGSHYMNYIRASNWGGPGRTYSTIFASDDRGKTWYDAMQLQIERPLQADMRWGGSLAYTLARSLEQGQTWDMFWGWDSRYPTVADRPRLRPPGDQRHVLVANGIVRLPADIRFSTIATFGSGTTQNATNASAGWGVGQQTTYTYTPPSQPFLGIGHVFATRNIDARLEKEFPLASGQHASLLIDVFNVFNARNYGCYEAAIFPTNGSPNANFGKPYCAGLGRRLQLGLRYGFRAAGSER